MPIVALTREMGSLGRDVAAGLARRIGCGVLYHEMVGPGADKMRLHKSHVERFLDGRDGVWERLAPERASRAMFTPDETFGLVRGHCAGVIRGWGAVHLLRDVPHVIRVRVCAPRWLRIERMVERLRAGNRQVVEDEIDLSEEAHTAIARRHFGVDWREPEHYDLVLCTERLTVEECVGEIEALVRRDSFRETPESLRRVDDLAREWAQRPAAPCPSS